MRTFEFRVYKPRTKEALDFYREQIYPRHLSSFPLLGGGVHQGQERDPVGAGIRRTKARLRRAELLGLRLFRLDSRSG